MKHSESIVNISKALLEVQKKIKNAKQTAENPFYKSSYAPLNEILDEVRPNCNANGITILHDIGHDNGNVIVSAMLLHTSGEWIQTDGMKLPLDKQTAQGAGSAVTYGRRYTISAILGIASEEDDDGNTGEKAVNKHFSQPNTDKMKSLPKDIKDAFNALGYGNKVMQAYQLCEDLNWDNDKIRARLNSLATEGK